MARTPKLGLMAGMPKTPGMLRMKQPNLQSKSLRVPGTPKLKISAKPPKIGRMPNLSSEARRPGGKL